MADKVFDIKINVGANIDPIKGSLNSLEAAFSKVGLPDATKNSISKTFSKLKEEIQSFENIAGKGFSNMGDISKADRSFEKIINLIKKLQSESADITGLDPEKLLPEASIKRVRELQEAWKKLDSVMAKSSKDNSAIKSKTNELTREQKELSRLKDSYDELATKNKSMAAFKGVNTKEIQKNEADIKSLRLEQDKLKQSGVAVSDPKYKDLTQQINALNAATRGLQTTNNGFDRSIQKNKVEMTALDGQMQSSKTTIQTLSNELIQLQNAASQSPKELDELRQKLADLKGIDISKIPVDLTDIKNIINTLNDDELNTISKALDDIKVSSDAVPGSTDKMADSLREAGESGQKLSQTAQEVENLRNQIVHFFSIGNTIQLFKRAINDAFETVKALDKAMTDTAVVTDFSVGDMWEELPKYTDAANKLGTTTLGAYQTMTLFYQQGLKTNEVFEVGTETMKMARIAGLEYTEATDLMTAALRGFNMEIDKASAQKVNDVYSKLAAITASDTEEIATAMTKTASIANSANMKFETTAAFLSQMIETTRESAENLGTAMKTIIARFTEMKNSPVKIFESEGEIIDVNKIDTALKSVGVTLVDTNNKFRDLDDVFLELAKKWDTLDVMQQRYVATMAAGSRQQSRFIAMMSDYERTMELVSAAENSAGASQEQFDKTVESLESKLNKLTNAWNEFVMGITNSDIIKLGVDLLTEMLNAINQITDSLGGPISGFAKLGIAIAGINAGKKIFSGVFASLSKSIAKAGKDSASGYDQGLLIGLEETAKKIRSIFSKDFWVGVSPNLSKFKTQPVITSLNNLQKAQNKVTTATKILNNAQTMNQQNASILEGLNKKIVAAESEKAAALYTSSVALGFNSTQQALLSSMVSAGVAADTAALAISSGLTAAQYNEMVAKVALTGATGAGAKAKLDSMIATYSELAAQQTSNKTLQMGLVTRIGYYAQLLFGNKLTRIAALQALGLATAEEAQALATGTAAGAQWSLNAALAAFPGGVILIIIAAIAAALIGIGIALYQTSDAFKLKEAKKGLESAKDAADAAAESYNNLATAITEIEDKSNGLDDLVKGTREWKQAVFELNQQVLDLVNNYPQLAKFVTSNNGILTIDFDNADVNDAIDTIFQNQIKAQQAYIGAEIYSTETETNNTGKKLYQELIGSYTNNAQSNMTTGSELLDKAFLQGKTSIIESYGAPAVLSKFSQEEYTKLAKDMSDGKLGAISTADGFNKENNSVYQENLSRIEKYISALGYSENEVKNLSKEIALTADKIMGFGNNLQTSDNKLSTFYTSLVGQAGENAGLTNGSVSNDERAVASNYATAMVEGIVEKNKNAILDTLNSNDPTVIQQAEKLKQEYATYMGYTLENGVFKKKGDDGKLVNVEGTSNQAIATQLASVQSGKDLSANMEYLADNFNNLPGILKKLFSSKGEGNLRREDIDIIKNKIVDKNNPNKVIDVKANNLYAQDVQDNLKAQAENLYRSSEFTTADRALFGSIDEFVNFYVGQINTSFEASFDAQKKAKRFGIGPQADAFITALNGQLKDDLALTLGQEKDFSNIFSDVYAHGGDIQAFQQQIIDLLNSVKDPKDLTTVVDLLSDPGNWSSEDAIKSTIKVIEDLGYELPGLADKFTEITKTIKKIDLNKIKKLTTDTFGLIDDLKDREDTDRKFTQEQYDTALDAGVDSNEFLWDGTQYNYIGNSIQELINALSKNTLALMGETQKLLTEKIERGRSLTSSNIDKKIVSILDGTARMVDGSLTRYWMSGDNGLGKGEFVQRDDITSALIQAGYKATDFGGLNNQAFTDYLRNTVLPDITDLDQNENDLKANTENSKGAVLTRTNPNELWNAYANGTTIDGGAELADFEIKLEDLNKGLEAQANAIGVTSSEIEVYTKKLVENGESQDKASAKAKLLLINLKKQQEVIDKISESMKDNLDVMDNNKKGTNEYQVALQTMADDFSKAFSFKVKTDWVEANKDQIKKWLAGSKEAGEAVAKSFTNSFIKESVKGMSGPQADAITSAVDSIITANSGQEIGLGMSLDITALLASLQAANISLKAFEDIIKGFGYEIKAIPTLATPQDSALRAMGISMPSGYTYKAVKTGSTSVNSLPVPSSAKGGSKGGGGGGSSDAWENSYNKFYNLSEAINQSLREREKLERTYNKLLKEQEKITNANDFQKNLADQIKNLRSQADTLRDSYARNNRMASLNTSEATSYMNANAAMKKYGSLNTKTGQITINYDEINKVTNQKEGEKIEKYIGKLEEIRDAIWEAEDAANEAEDALQDLKDQLQDMLDELKQNYLDFEDRVKDALVERRQEEIDTLQQTYDLLADSNTKILDSIQKIIDEQRKQRELDKARDDIEKQQRRLAILRQDTSGASDLEIKQLEQSIQDAQQSYTDSLIDKAIEDMAEANQKAEEQRNIQIELLQHQLELDEKNGEFWAEVNSLMKTAINKDGSLNNNSPLVKLLQQTEGFASLSKFGKQNWFTELGKTISSALAGLKEWMNPTDVDKAIGGITGGNAGPATGTPGTTTPSTGSSGSGSSGGSGGSNKIAALQKFLKDNGFYSGNIDGVNGTKTKAAVKAMQKMLLMPTSEQDGIYGAKTRSAIVKSGWRFKGSLPAYKKGGLADFTGPAWMDGTPSKPELVLKARDTENFIVLKDALTSLLDGKGTSEKSGDNYYEIHIEVDSLSSDYDVEQVASKVKQIINSDARYRNVNSVNLLR